MIKCTEDRTMPLLVVSILKCFKGDRDYTTANNALGVRPMGVSGMMYIQCTQCGTINKLKLGKTHRPPDSKKTGVGIFDVNTKLAAGIGETQLNNLLSTIKVYYIDHKSLKRRENEIGHIIEQNAKTSENNFLLEEAIGSLVIGIKYRDADLEENRLDIGISVSTDTCWQKKGSGRSYNSLSAISLDNDVEEEIPEPLNIRIEGDMRLSPLVMFDLQTTSLSRY
ncbi:unnamed protein product [Mytilus coruscus]|uniref:Mutator-like transposase domain-containing protein n=1 Tax=Mytilus coruscus TaxID=42192 RepID=A0A6J8ET92_MYTCO|nr:unnamed protein product [Mytilus coruscus]